MSHRRYHVIIDYFEDSKAYDCYAREKFGVFIPILDDRFKLSKTYEYPCYEVIVDFNSVSDKAHNYRATITSPNISHKRKGCRHCYIVLIDKEFFESRYYMYNNELRKY